MYVYRRTKSSYKDIQLMNSELDSISDLNSYNKDIIELVLNYTAHVHKVVKPLYDEYEIIQNLNVFRKAFPFFEKNNTSESIIEEIIDVVMKVYNILYNSFDTDVVISDRLKDFLEKYNYFKREKYPYLSSINKLGQNHITVIGYIILLAIFLGSAEKKLLALDLVGGLGVYSYKLISIVERNLDKILSAQYSYSDYKSDNDYGEIIVYSLILRRYLIYFLLDVKTNLPQTEKFAFDNNFLTLLGELFGEKTIYINNIKKMLEIVSGGYMINEHYYDNRVGISYIVNLLHECIMNSKHDYIFQKAIDNLFILTVSMKYSNHYIGIPDIVNKSFSVYESEFCKNVIFCNSSIITPDDEQTVYNKSRVHNLSYYHHYNNENFYDAETGGWQDNHYYICPDDLKSFLGCLRHQFEFMWNKINTIIYDIDLNLYDVLINNKEVQYNFFSLEQNDKLNVYLKNGYEIVNWNETIINDTDVAKIVIRTPMCNTDAILTEKNDFTVEETILKKYTGHNNKVIIPDGITKIDKWAFSECENVMTVHIPNSVTTVNNNAFNKCTNLKFIIIPESVTYIGAEAFNHCYSLITVVVLGNPSLDKDAFSNCKHLCQIIVPHNFEYDIEYHRSWCDDIESRKEHMNIIFREVFYDELNKTRVINNDFLIIGDILYEYLGNDVEVTIPDGITKIGDRAFYRNSIMHGYGSRIQSVIIPNGVTSIGDSAFCMCWDLKKIIIPDGVTFIGEDAFQSCRSLNNIHLPNSINHIGKSAFASSGVRNITLPKKLEIISEYTFCGSQLTNITISNSVTDIEDCAFSNCHYLKKIVIPGSITKIGDNVFDNCRCLREVTIMRGVECIGRSAFWGCKNLISITIPGSVKSIGDYAFEDCKRLSTIKVPDNFNINELDIPENCKIVYINEINDNVINDVEINDSKILISTDRNVSTNLKDETSKPEVEESIDDFLGRFI